MMLHDGTQVSIKTEICPSFALVQPYKLLLYYMQRKVTSDAKIALAPSCNDDLSIMAGQGTVALDFIEQTDDEILAAMAFLFERLKVVAEPSGASAVAALLARKVNVANLCVGVVISGGNIGIQCFCALLAGKN